MIGRTALAFLALVSALPAIALEAQIELEIDRPARPVIVGTTNLPDGAEMTITIRRSDRRMIGQASATVIGGRFISSRFSAQGRDYSPGDYTVEVYLPTEQRDERVKRAIGERGRKLTGRLVKRSDDGNAVELVQRFEVAKP